LLTIVPSLQESYMRKIKSIYTNIYLLNNSPDLSVGYTVKGAYCTLTCGMDPITSTSTVHAPLIWRKNVPLKASIFGWRLFQNRLPTKANLFQRGIIHSEDQRCVSGCGEIEMDTHLFFSCSIFGQVWQLVRRWLGVYSAEPSTIVDHYLQFGTSSGLAKPRCSFMYLIWFASSWTIWKKRNARIFRSKQSTLYQLLENSKLLSFWWYKAQFAVYHFKFYDWCQHPLSCLGVG